MTSENDRNELLKPGAIFEKYTVEKLLGRGGMGAVYLVRHNVLDSLFALKVLSPAVAEKNKQFVDRFIREAKLACKIRHPNLIAVHDAGKNPENGMYYIVMDYVPGGSVRDLLKKEHRLTPQRALEIITQIAGALAAAHEHHMVHRDIKPDNIMFASDGTAKLADLGIAKSTDEQDTMLTMASSVFGTPAYMSPEQAKDSRNVDSRADIYSLGIVFYEMLAGQRPYRGDSMIEILSQVISDTEVPDIRTVCPKIFPELAELVAAMTAKKLKKRIADPATLLHRLHEIRIPATPASPPPTPTYCGTADTADGTLTSIERQPPELPTSETATPHPLPIAADGGGGETAPVEKPQEDDRSAVTIPTLVKKAPDRGPEPVPDVAVTQEKPDDDSVGGRENSPDAADGSEKTVALVPSAAPRETVPGKYDAERKPPRSPKNTDSEAVPTVRMAAEPPKTSASPENRRTRLRRKKLLLAIGAVPAAVLIFCAAYLLLAGKPDRPTTSEASPAVEADVARTSKSIDKNEVTEKAAVPRNTPADAPTGTPVAETVSTQDAPGAAVTPTAPAAPSAPKEIGDDPLGRNQIVLLAGASEAADALKTALSSSFGSEKVSFQQAESMGKYKEKLQSIAKSAPIAVVLAFAGKYAEDRLSKASFENIIRQHADLLRDYGIPFVFVLAPERDDDGQLHFFNAAIADLCKLKSIPLVTDDGGSNADLVNAVKSVMKR